jgi:hypothetical protein
MSVIKNTEIKRGDKLTSTALNAEFAAVNTAFTMDADNFRTESIDQPAFDTNSAHGRSGIILKAAQTFSTINSGTLTINANTNADSVAPQAATEIGAETVAIVAKQNDIFRVYWQYDFNTEGNSSTDPYDADLLGWNWAIWLEWQLSSGGAFTPVTGQGDLDNAITVGGATKYGDLTSNLKACSIDYHGINYDSGSADVVVYPGRRNGYGQYFYKFTSDTTIYGLRLMVRGLYEPIYATTSNALKSLQASTSGGSHVHKFVLYRADLSYLLMRNE